MNTVHWSSYQDWEKGIPTTLTADPVWSVRAYRLALFCADIGWADITRLMQDKRTRALSDQLYRALGSIGANITEGYSHRSRKDQARFYEYALGSARESKDWYYKSRHILGDEVVQHRMSTLTEIVRLLLVMIPERRGHQIHEKRGVYRTESYPEDIPYPAS